MTPSPGIEPGPHCWEACVGGKCSTTAPSLACSTKYKRFFGSSIRCGFRFAIIFLNRVRENKLNESSDEDVDISTDDNSSQGQQDELGTSTNFLFAVRSRYGRAVRLNNRLLYDLVLKSDSSTFVLPDDQESNKLCRLVSSVQSHIRPFCSQYRSLVTDCGKISIEYANSRLSSQNTEFSMGVLSSRKNSPKVLYCDS